MLFNEVNIHKCEYLVDPLAIVIFGQRLNLQTLQIRHLFANGMFVNVIDERNKVNNL